MKAGFLNVLDLLMSGDFEQRMFFIMMLSCHWQFGLRIGKELSETQNSLYFDYKSSKSCSFILYIIFSRFLVWVKTNYFQKVINFTTHSKNSLPFRNLASFSHTFRGEVTPSKYRKLLENYEVSSKSTSLILSLTFS